MGSLVCASASAGGAEIFSVSQLYSKQSMFRNKQFLHLRRVSELIALVSVSTTLFLFIQTRDLSHRLHEIQDPNLDLSAFGAKIDSGKSGGRSIEDITKPKSHLSRELSNEKVKLNPMD